MDAQDPPAVETPTIEELAEETKVEEPLDLGDGVSLMSLKLAVPNTDEDHGLD